jgi:hypothetical protein
MKTIVALTIAAASLFGSAAAAAYPGDPNPGCESTFGGVLMCDGPIRPDGSWQRCSERNPLYMPPIGNVPGAYSPGGTNCKVVWPGNIPWDSPQYHIG